ncbi:MAG: glutamate-5-semialdehyde dehydrogenase [Alphaproteobacteria bacterium]|nr:glutamate-5-semialdehyde dehydrogenase [Alphaproteobacteria bacterium]HCP00599.1 glutamate-5-semialdehyde dehydrogenase [Rhodospirillaceae bacterium]
MTAAQDVSVDEADIRAMMRGIGVAAKVAAYKLAGATAESKNAALHGAAAAIRARKDEILAANADDVNQAEAKGVKGSFLDRLTLDDDRVEMMAHGLEEVASLADPVGTVLAEWERPNGLKITRVRVPLGVIGVIYESRPNVTADAGGLCLKAGNAAILRGGSESFQSSRAILSGLRDGLRTAGLPEDAIQAPFSADRAAVGAMLTMVDSIDVIVPRGGKSLIERVQTESRIPVFAHLEGLCHTYVHCAADTQMARDIVLNSKMRRTGICGATETVLIDRSIAPELLSPIVDDLVGAGCEVRGDASARDIDGRIVPANDDDWDTEYLDAIVSVRVVDDIDDAITHVNNHGSNHTDAIVTADTAAAERFLANIDSGIVLHNASTQFADGGEFGMGAEIGISTGKMHARGPVGAEQLTSYKYVVRGAGQIRP